MSELKRHMGLFHLTMYGVGLILGAGIYVLIGEAAGIAGDSVWISFMLGTIVAIFAGLSYAELTSVFPKAAAEYTFVKRAFKNNFLGFLIGWLTAITSVITASVVALGFGGYLLKFIDIPIILSAAGLIVALSVVNFIGIRESAWTNTVFTIVEAAGLILIIVIGFTFVSPEPVDYFDSPTGLSGVVIAFVLVFFAFIGFEDMANVAEEVRQPKKNLPRAVILSVVISGAIYILVALAAVRVVNWHELGLSAAPMADIASKALGEKGNILLSSIALFATTNTVLITLVAGARIFYGMARDGSLPSKLGLVHSKTKTPWIAVLGIMIASAIFTLVGDIVIVANITVFAIVITFAMINLAVIVLRYTEPDIERPFKIPFNIKRFPILPLFGLAITVYMMFQFEFEIVVVGLGIIGAGCVVYLIYGKKKRK
ncbi:amino acid permease [Nitrosopumilus sp. K4]|uniref:APC family permease n=1 Tax=Nitrosopumilus sp. K4 TaxID=2795383 RepID=UPI001BA95B35|nr:APC family permease [Nitrosopumilus sp. K4]QUC64134.1 amino acid permease [Nitrosopumilus sp. K4]